MRYACLQSRAEVVERDVVARTEFGFVAGSGRKRIELMGGKVVMFDAGGAGSAKACGSVAKGVKSISIIDIQPERSVALVKKLRHSFPGCDAVASSSVPSGVDLIVNASTFRMRVDDGLPWGAGMIGVNTVIGYANITDEPTAGSRARIPMCCWERCARQAGRYIASFFPRSSVE